MATLSNVIVRPWWFVSGAQTLTSASIFTLEQIVGISPQLALVAADAILIDVEFLFTSNDTADNTVAFGVSVNTTSTIQFPAIGNVPKITTFSATSVVSYGCKRRLTGLNAGDTIYFLCQLTIPGAAAAPGASVAGFAWF